VSPSSQIVADARYYALSALAAALHYIEKAQAFGFLAGSLRVSYVALEGKANFRAKLKKGTLFIDVDTARNLELVKNNITHKTSNTLYGQSGFSHVLILQASSITARHPWDREC
jgi:DNA mismatch repair protein MSH4